MEWRRRLNACGAIFLYGAGGGRLAAFRNGTSLNGATAAIQFEDDANDPLSVFMQKHIAA
ncbi:hypothetical protein DID96_29195 [Burkholderia sp. Bp8963]|uniref:hypothetical protein n=1 Tax=Burkholderia sp. Bp8963 TaxID=2184547 RepID=UPI000F5AF581|nr:hypothetical protein [Burkholderia sp. Bp8963]RQS63621.1 hypothetical protein DID96_29195 [Burkholderia sp. Bp8963]